MASALPKTDDLKDPLWRLNNLYRIINKDGQEVLFELNQQQWDLIKGLHKRDVILKARQLGITTLMCVVGLDEAVFVPNWRVAIIAHKLDDAKSIFDTKVKFPYLHLPEQILKEVTSTRESVDTLALSNNSVVEVKTSARSGTYNRLHVSEYGKICAVAPEKAKEIKTGSFPAAERGDITVESTAEGQAGEFFEMVQRARALQQMGKEPSPKEFKFHFFPWWKSPEYESPPEWVTATPEDEAYFRKLETQGISLTPEKKAWWMLTEREQGGDMLREYPATPEEAFEQAIDGAIFERQLTHARKHGHIGEFPFNPQYPVNSFWDIGRNDLNVIWLHQHIKGRNRFIGYYENSGEYIAHYVEWLREWAKEHSASWDEHYLPHDGNRKDLFLEHGRAGVMEDLNFRPKIVDRVADKWAAIETARNMFADCDFDETQCAAGIKRLAHYRKEYDENRGTFRNKPLHDDNSNAADAYMTFSTAWKGDTKIPEYFKKRRRGQQGSWQAA